MTTRNNRRTRRQIAYRLERGLVISMPAPLFHLLVSWRRKGSKWQRTRRYRLWLTREEALRRGRR